MNFFEEIEDIRKAIFTERRLETLLAAYQAELREWCADFREQGYAETKALLSALLSEDQRAKLEEVEAGGMSNLAPPCASPFRAACSPPSNSTSPESRRRTSSPHWSWTSWRPSQGTAAASACWTGRANGRSALRR